jgi:hypothetical protein
MNILKVISVEHKEIESIFELISKTENRDSKKRRLLFERLSNLLISHTSAEEATFYRELAADPKEKFDLLEAKEEHRLAEKLLIELGNIDCGDETWLPKLTVLKENIQHHVQEEESKLFKFAKKHIPEEVLVQLGKDFLDKSRGHHRGLKKSA